MPEHLDWQRVNPRDAVAFAIERLWQGQLLVLPTDTCYVAACSALQVEAVQRLARFGAADGPAAELELAVRGLGECLDWVPGMSTIGRRLAGRCWPGPLTLRCDVRPGEGVADRLPDEVRRRLCATGKLALRSPYHEAALSILIYFPGPVVVTRLLTPDGTEVTRAEDALAAGAAADVIVTDGDTPFARPASVVEVNGSSWSVAREGAVAAEELARLAACQIVFVCTGNTCRSPLAEALCKKLLAEQLRCTADELPARGFHIFSAGLSAMPGSDAAPLAVETAHGLGADLTCHRSQPLTGELLAHSDHVLAMTHSHLQALAGHGMNKLASAELLSCEGEDIPDPIGGEREVYAECARQILKHLERRLPQFLQA